MQSEETKNILSLLKVAYPNQFRNMSKEDGDNMLMLWSVQFKDYDYSQVLNAVQIHVSKSQYIPSIAEIKGMIVDSTPKIEDVDYWHKRFGYGNEPIYYDDDFSENVVWEDVPKYIRERMEYHCNPKDYESYNAVARKVIEVTGNTSVKFYTSKDTEFLKGKMVTWTNEVMTV